MKELEKTLLMNVLKAPLGGDGGYKPGGVKRN
jgi:hypothetical protein